MLYRISVTLCYQILTVVVGWHIYDLTKDVITLGLIGLAEVIPYFCSALFAGHAVDNFSKKLIAIVGCSIHIVIAAILILATQGFLNNSLISIEWIIYLTIGLAGLARALLRPTYQVLFSMALERDQYARGTALGTIIFQIALVVGPAIGGFLIAWTGLTFAYAITGLFGITGLISVLSLNYTNEPKADQSSVWESISEGFRFVFSKEILLAAMALDMFAVLFGGAVSILPAFIHDILNGNPENLGLLRAMPALGSALIGFWLARFPIDDNAGKHLLLSVAAFGISIIGLGFSTSLVVAAFWLLLSGIFDGVSIVLRQTILQLMTPDKMRGRVSSINGIFIGSSNEIGALESGIAASLLGIAPSIILGGFLTLLVVGVCYIKAPKLRRLHLRHLHHTE